MSTSSDKQAALSFFKGQLAVLFVLHCRAGTDAATGATHIGAVLTPVSQYPGEAETLFPPLTMLEVLKDEGTGKFMIYEKEHTKADGEKVVVKEIHVAPSFVHQV